MPLNIQTVKLCISWLEIFGGGFNNLLKSLFTRLNSKYDIFLHNDIAGKMWFRNCIFTNYYNANGWSISNIIAASILNNYLTPTKQNKLSPTRMGI